MINWFIYGAVYRQSSPVWKWLCMLHWSTRTHLSLFWVTPMKKEMWVNASNSSVSVDFIAVIHCDFSWQSNIGHPNHIFFLCPKVKIQVSKDTLGGIPLWIIIVSILIGLLILALVIFVLWKVCWKVQNQNHNVYHIAYSVCLHLSVKYQNILFLLSQPSWQHRIFKNYLSRAFFFVSINFIFSNEIQSQTIVFNLLSFRNVFFLGICIIG